MTTRPLRKPVETDGLRVIRGHRLRKPTVAPWVIVAVIGVAAFLGLGFARTSLDRNAFELAELERAISEESALNQQLRLEIARLESPARIAPLAEGLGMVIPRNTHQIMVDLDPEGPALAALENEGKTQ